MLGDEFSFHKLPQGGNGHGCPGVLIESRKEVVPRNPLGLLLGEPVVALGGADPYGPAPTAPRFARAVNLVLAPPKFPPAALLVQVTLLL